MASLIEFLTEVGVEDLTCQPLHACMTGSAMRKGGDTEVKFLTREITPADMVGKMRKTAFIVWMDAEKFDAALAKLQGNENEQ